MKQPSLFDGADAEAVRTGDRPADAAAPPPPDQAARDYATDPAHDVVLEASAGTGKTRVLVDRYVRLIERGIEPGHILAITFTRKAAAEMRQRVLAELRRRAADGRIPAARWRTIRERLSEIQISTIDAFCFTLLREFPLEAGVDPGFDIADETEMGRFAREATDRALRAARPLLVSDDTLRLLLTRVKLPVLVRTLAEMIDRRHIAQPAVAAFVARTAAAGGTSAAAQAFVRGIGAAIAHSPHRAALLDRGPGGSAEYRWLRQDLLTLDALAFPDDLPKLQHLRRRVERYFLTKAGEPRKTASLARAAEFAGPADRAAHNEAVKALAPLVRAELDALELRINAVLARGFHRLLAIAVDAYERLLDDHALLDFAGMLDRAVRLLERQEEFARSRLKLQARYHHVLVDEFQDTSRLQWRLIDLLIDAWGEGEGAADTPTSIFIVGDRKQSIYRFRHAEVTLLEEAARRITALRGDPRARQAITTSFRAVPELLAFVNALSAAVESDADIPERFRYTDRDRFPAPEVGAGALRDGEPVLGVIAESSSAQCAAAVASEVSRLLAHVPVRTREGVRPARPDDIVILFRSRAGHQYFETALEARGIRTYVYKGLGFFDAPEVQDLQALMRFLAQPDSHLRAAEFLRSRFIRLTDPALVALAPDLAGALTAAAAPAALPTLDAADRGLLTLARAGVARWLALADRVSPGELVDTVIRESAYARELAGQRIDQARENVKKVKGLIRRVESRGYATVARIAEYFETLRTGDESNAIIEAAGAVNLMTMHAAKGLEFPIVFLVNMHQQSRGRSNITVIERGLDGEPEVAFTSTDGTKLEDLRETEELRRLLYVGATRARDRLYLAAEVDAKAQVKRGARSLVTLLPKSLQDVFGESIAARAAGDRVTWTTEAGAFAFRICGPDEAPPAASRPEADERPFDLAWLGTAEPALTSSASVTPAPEVAEGAGRIVGTLVHRLVQSVAEAPLGPDTAEGRARDLLRPEDRAVLDDPEDVIRTAAALFTRLHDKSDLRQALETGRVYFEVPFSTRAREGAGGLIRGVIDCLIVRPDGPPLVLEFKTGQPQAGHEAQAGTYAEAVRQMLGVEQVEARILYA